MTHDASAHTSELGPDTASSVSKRAAPVLRLVVDELQPTAAACPVLIVAADALACLAPPPPDGPVRAFWRRWFGPPEIDVRGARSDFGVFRAMYEIGSDYLPSSGTWPTR
jgi:hypothetical protein